MFLLCASSVAGLKPDTVCALKVPSREEIKWTGMRCRGCCTQFNFREKCCQGYQCLHTHPGQISTLSVSLHPTLQGKTGKYQPVQRPSYFFSFQTKFTALSTWSLACSFLSAWPYAASPDGDPTKHSVNPAHFSLPDPASHLYPGVLFWKCWGVEFVLLDSCPHHNKKLKGRDTVVRWSRSFTWMHSKGGMGQRQAKAALLE